MAYVVSEVGEPVVQCHPWGAENGWLSAMVISALPTEQPPPVTFSPASQKTLAAVAAFKNALRVWQVTPLRGCVDGTGWQGPNDVGD